MVPIKRFHPGVYIKDSLEAINMTNEELSKNIGIIEESLSNIILGKESITLDIAEKLSKFFETSIEYWMKLQKQYDIYSSNMEVKK